MPRAAARAARERDDIGAEVRAAIASIAPEADLAAILPDVPLREQVDLDSMDWLNVVTALHQHLAIDIPEADYERLATLEAIVAYVEARRKKRPVGRRKAAPSPKGLHASSHVVAGHEIVVRPMRPDDADREVAFVRHLSEETRYNRFMLTVRELSKPKLEYLTDVDQDHHVALVATTAAEGGEMFVGVVRYIADAKGTGCEFAIAIDDAWQGTGLAGILMHRLVGAARAHGIATMEGLVLRTNGRMLKFTRQLGFRPEVDPEDNQTLRVVRAL
jgi:acetyltransferase